MNILKGIVVYLDKLYNYPKNMYTYNISSKFFDRDILNSKVKNLI